MLKIWIVLALIALIGIVFSIVRFRKGKKLKQPSRLTGLAFCLIMFGIFFVDQRQIGYPLIGLGVFLSLAEIFIKIKKK